MMKFVIVIAFLASLPAFSSERVESFDQVAATSYIYEFDIKNSNSQKIALKATHTNALYLCLSKGFKTLVAYEKEETKGKLGNIMPNGEISGYNYDTDRPQESFSKLTKIECRLEFDNSSGLSIKK